MEYIAVIITGGTLPLPITPEGEVWHVVPTASDLPTVRLALAHGAIPIVGEGTPFAAVERATRLDLARPWAQEQPYLDRGDRIYLLTRGWRLLDDGAVEIAAWQEGEPTEVLCCTVQASRVGESDKHISSPSAKMATCSPMRDFPDLDTIFVDLRYECVQALMIEHAPFLAADRACKGEFSTRGTAPALRPIAPGFTDDSWKYVVATMQDRQWPDPTDSLRPPGPPTAVQLLYWTMDDAGADLARAVIGFRPAPDPRVVAYGVTLLDSRRQTIFTRCSDLDIARHQIAVQPLAWDEPYEVVMNSIDGAGNWSITSERCHFALPNPHAPQPILPATTTPRPLTPTTDRWLVATATFGEPAPPPVTAGWWCEDCAAFVLLAGERVGGLCLECGGRETVWREP